MVFKRYYCIPVFHRKLVFLRGLFVDWVIFSVRCVNVIFNFVRRYDSFSFSFVRFCGIAYLYLKTLIQAVWCNKYRESKINTGSRLLLWLLLDIYDVVLSSEFVFGVQNPTNSPDLKTKILEIGYVFKSSEHIHLLIGLWC